MYLQRLTSAMFVQPFSLFHVNSFRYGLYSAVSTVNPDCLTPHLAAITEVMMRALKSSEGITV